MTDPMPTWPDDRPWWTQDTDWWAGFAVEMATGCNPADDHEELSDADR
jgi:hypothetical protein